MKDGSPENAEAALRAMLEAEGRIALYLAGMCVEQFAGTDIVRDATIRRCALVGRASRELERIDPALCEAEPALASRAFRVIEGAVLEEIDPGYLWRAATADLPRLAAAARRVLVARGG